MIAAPLVSLLSFHVGSSRVALPLRMVREVMDHPTIVPVPGSLSHVAGVALKGGVAIPAYDLERFGALWRHQEGVGQMAGTERWSHLILCEFGEVLLGLLGEQVDLTDGLADTQGEDDDGGCEMLGDYVSGLLRSGTERVALLDPVKLFPSLGVPADGSGSAREDGGEEDPAGR